LNELCIRAHPIRVVKLKECLGFLLLRYQPWLVIVPLISCPSLTNLWTDTLDVWSHPSAIVRSRLCVRGLAHRGGTNWAWLLQVQLFLVVAPLVGFLGWCWDTQAFSIAEGWCRWIPDVWVFSVSLLGWWLDLWFHIDLVWYILASKWISVVGRWVIILVP